MNKKLSVAIMVAGLALCSAVFAAGKGQSAEVAAPFGVSLGKTTCQEVAAKFSAKVVPFEHLFLVKHPRAQDELPGAVGIEVLCLKPDGPVAMLSVLVSKSEGTAIYRSLSKYKLVKGGPPPNLGDAYALFNDAAGSYIQLAGPHLSFNLELSYMTAETYNRMVAYNQSQRDEKAKKRGNL